MRARARAGSLSLWRRNADALLSCFCSFSSLAPLPDSESTPAAGQQQVQAQVVEDAPPAASVEAVTAAGQAVDGGGEEQTNGDAEATAAAAMADSTPAEEGIRWG